MSESFKKIIKLSLILSLIFVMGSIFAPKTQAATKDWSKNSKGQFVNDKGKVIKGATMKGVDVSKWQGNISWKKVAKTDVDFAIIRCGFGDNLTSQDDEYWEKNVAGCIKYKIPFGTYLYSYAKNATQAKSEAHHVLRLLKGRDVYFPIYYDMEEDAQAKLGKTKVGQLANTFMDEIRAQGYKVGIYANLNWWTNYIPGSFGTNTEISKWVAQWDHTLGYKGSANMWQCTSKGSVNGISGRVDLNFWFGAYNANWYKRSITVRSSITTPRPAKAKIKSIKAKHRKLVVKVKKAKDAVGYRVKYSRYKSMKKSKSKYSRNRKITLKNLKGKKRYYIQVKSYNTKPNGKRLYAKKWSNKKSKKTKK